MDKVGLLADVALSVTSIDQGRKWLDTDGMEREGRISYRQGLDIALTKFTELQSSISDDLRLLIRVEYSFLSQELLYCDDSDTQSKASLEQAIYSFDDALRSLEAVEDYDGYKVAELTYPRSAKTRYKNMPKDAFHAACMAHRTRIGNFLRTPGINMAEKALLTQRSANMKTAQDVYLEKQKKALGL